MKRFKQINWGWWLSAPACRWPSWRLRLPGELAEIMPWSVSLALHWS